MSLKTDLQSILNNENPLDNLISYIKANFKRLDDTKVDWIDEWLGIFPKGVKTSGKPVRSDREGCLKKMENFVRKYPYSKDLIMKVTKKYIEDKLNSNSYIKCATYFIHHKEDGSDLAALCENYEENTVQTPKIINDYDFI